MLYRYLADTVALAHLSFVLFVVLGGLLALRWRRAAWVHLPAAVWGAVVEIAGWICPLTPLENWLRHRAGEQGLSGGFVEHYVVTLLYPPGLTRAMQLGLGLFVLGINGLIYWRVFARRRRRG